MALHLYNQGLYRPLKKETRFLNQEKLKVEGEFPLLRSDKDELARLEEKYKREFEEFSQFEESVTKLEERLPSRKDMAILLEELTKELEDLKGDFVSLEPTLKKAGEGQYFDSLEIQVRFYADYPRVTEYLEKLEKEPLLLSVKKLEMKLDQEESPKPLVTIAFSTFVSDRATKKPEEPKQASLISGFKNPFHSETKPYDNRLPGEHHLAMVVWKGGRGVALIDGKLMKENSIIENRKLTKIESNGVWFSDESGVRYYLALEKK